MDALKTGKEVDNYSQKLLKLRENASDLEKAIIEDTVEYVRGHLAQINRYLAINSEYLDNIGKQQKPKKPK